MILLTGTGSNAEQKVVFTVTWPIPNAYFQCFFYYFVIILKSMHLAKQRWRAVSKKRRTLRNKTSKLSRLTVWTTTDAASDTMKLGLTSLLSCDNSGISFDLDAGWYFSVQSARQFLYQLTKNNSISSPTKYFFDWLVHIQSGPKSGTPVLFLR